MSEREPVAIRKPGSLAAYRWRCCIAILSLAEWICPSHPGHLIIQEDFRARDRERERESPFAGLTNWNFKTYTLPECSSESFTTWTINSCLYSYTYLFGKLFNDVAGLHFNMLKSISLQKLPIDEMIKYCSAFLCCNNNQDFRFTSFTYNF